MEKQLIELDALVQAIHKREKSMTAYQCYDIAIKILNINSLNKISESLESINYEVKHLYQQPW